MKNPPCLCTALATALLSACGSTPERAGDAVPAQASVGPSASGDVDALEAAAAEAETAFRDLLEGMGVEYMAAERALEVSGWVNMQSGLVEVFACSPGGKTHEAVVVVDCVPSGLHAGLLALGLHAGTPVETGTDGEYVAPTGDGVRVSVRWQDADGNERSARAEEWIWDAGKERSMEPCAWTFAGSFLQEAGGEETTYAADYIKSIVTTYHDASSVLENPLSSGADDTVYYANERAVPVVGTTVTVVFQPAE